MNFGAWDVGGWRTRSLLWPLYALFMILLLTVLLRPGEAQDWSHVYKPSRLIVKAKLVTVTGVIVDATRGKHRDGVRHEADGDCHGWLKLDPGQEKYLNAGNMSVEG